MAKKRMPSTARLAIALEQLGDPSLDKMIKLARQGYYDEYKIPIAFPIIQLVKDLEKAGYPGMAERARDGEWDAHRWEAEEWFRKEGKALFDSEFFKKKGKKHTTI